jgi:hypothetical protein
VVSSTLVFSWTGVSSCAAVVRASSVGGWAGSIGGCASGARASSVGAGGSEAVIGSGFAASGSGLGFFVGSGWASD